MPAGVGTVGAMVEAIERFAERNGVPPQEWVWLLEDLARLVNLRQENWSVRVTLAMMHREAHARRPEVACRLSPDDLSLDQKLAEWGYRVVSRMKR